MPQKKSGNQLRIRCRKHPRYNAARVPKQACSGCALLFLRRWSSANKQERLIHLSGVDPSLFVGDFEEACYNLDVRLHRE